MERVPLEAGGTRGGGSSGRVMRGRIRPLRDDDRAPAACCPTAVRGQVDVRRKQAGRRPDRGLHLVPAVVVTTNTPG